MTRRRVVVWHPDIPGVRLRVSRLPWPRWRRRAFASLSEARRPDAEYVSGLPWLWPWDLSAEPFDLTAEGDPDGR